MAETLTQKLNRLDEVPDAFISSIEKYEKKLLDEILELLDILERDERGYIIYNTANQFNIDTIANRIRYFMFNGEYADIVESFANEFDIQLELNNKYFTDTFDEFTPKDIYADTFRITKRKQLELFNTGAINEIFMTPLNDNLQAAITGKMNYRQFRKSIKNYVLGQEQLEGQLTRYVKQVAKDSFSVYDRTYTQAVSSDLNVQFYQYIGGLVKDSRCFCIDRSGKYYSKGEIEQFGNKENLSTCREESRGIVRWQGMYRGTNATTIFNFAGGYNCNHTWTPVSIFSVPKVVIERNIKSGLVKIDKKTRDLLGI